MTIQIKNRLALRLTSLFLTYLQSSTNITVFFLYVAPILMLSIFFASPITNILPLDYLQSTFPDEISIDEKDLFAYYSLLVLIVTIIIELIETVFKKSLVLSLKFKLLSSLSFFLISYFILAITFILKDEVGFGVLVLLCVFSILYCLSIIAFNHGIGYLKRQLNTVDVKDKNNK